MNRYDLSRFTERIKDLEFFEMLDVCTKAYTAAERAYNKHTKEEKPYVRQYYVLIRDFVHFLKTGQIPGSSGKMGLAFFKKAVINLVDKGNLNRDALDAF